MDSTEPDWNLYRSFLAVMREGSLSAAARALGMTQPTLGRHITSLEVALDAALFTRAPDGLRPTALAHQLRTAVEGMASAARHATRVVSDNAHEEGGTVRITASEIVGGEVLPRMLARYRERHPRLVIELVLSNRNDDLLKREADIAVRMARPTQQALLAKRLGKVDIGLFAHQAYVRAHGMPTSPLALPEHTLIGYDREALIADLARQQGLSVQREVFSFRCDNDLGQLAALRAGIGIGGCQWGIARRDPALIPVLSEQLHFSLDMWLVMHADQRGNKRVIALFRFLTEELGQYVASSARG